jgi:hypothetical protein
MGTRELSAIALGLVGLHTLALPVTSEEVGRSLGYGASKLSECGCGGAKETKQLMASGKSLQALSTTSKGRGAFDDAGDGADDPEPLYPQCPTGSPCTSQNWTWWQCIKVNNNPLQCQLWSLDVIRWFCPGVTYYCCVGDWSYEGDNCAAEGLTCTSGLPTTLPADCTPPVPPADQRCIGC